MTDLAIGDIAIVRYHSDGLPLFSDTVGTGFDFVVLTDIDNTRPVFFTTNSFNTAGATTTDEYTWRWDPPAGGVSAGTVVTFVDTIPGAAALRRRPAISFSYTRTTSTCHRSSLAVRRTPCFSPPD